LGDWGKGGIYGDILAPTISPTVFPSRHPTSSPSILSRRLSDEITDIPISSEFLHRDNVKQSMTLVSSVQSTSRKASRQLKDQDDKEGDIDITYTYQVAVAKALGTWASTNSPSFVIALGDNFYTNGVASTSDVMWNTHWKQVYMGYTKLNIPWMPVFGNHDYGYGNSGVQAQLDYAKIDSLWQMKGKNYSQYFTIPDGGTVAIIFIDTTTLAPSVNKCCNSKGGVSEAVQLERITSQLKNIEKMLEEAVSRKSTWIFIAGIDKYIKILLFFVYQSA
jgi:hypothetical protein